MKSFFAVAGSLVMTVLFYLAWWESPLISYFDYKIYDRLAQMFPSSNRPDRTVVVEIDDKSLKEFGQWPWPRMITAELIHTIHKSHPSGIVLDIVFSEPDRSSPATMEKFYRDRMGLDIRMNGVPEPLRDNDRILAGIIADSRAVLPIFSDPGRESGVCFFPDSIPILSEPDRFKLVELESPVCSLRNYQSAAGGIGHIHAVADEDGTFRRLALIMRYQDMLIPTLGIAALRSDTSPLRLTHGPRLGGQIGIETEGRNIASDAHGRSLLYFYPYESYSRISAYDVLNGTADLHRLEGKYVLIGTTALGLDTWHTISAGTIRPGVNIHATLMENILHGDLKVQPSSYPALNSFLALICGLVLWLLMQRKRYLGVIFVFSAVIVLSVSATYIAWAKNVYISIGYLILPLGSYLFVLSLLMFFIDYRDKKRFFDEIRRKEEQKKRLQNELERSESEIEYQKAMLFQQSRLAAMGEMIDYIAHQWRQPLNLLGVIVQHAEFAFHKGKVDGNYMRKLSSDSMEQILFMSQTVDDFRNFVKPDRKNLPFTIRRPIEESVRLLGGMLSSHSIAVETYYADEGAVIKGSPSELKQVVINLIQNARDALVENTSSGRLIRIETFQDGVNAFVAVTDNGGGIAPDIIRKIFDPHFTTKEEGKGSGVGLYICDAVVRGKIGGKIEVESTNGMTKFILSFPLSPDNVDEFEEIDDDTEEEW